MSTNPQLKGIVLILLAAALWGVSYPFWKVLASKTGPIGLTAASFCLSTVIMYLYDRKPLSYLSDEFRKAPAVATLLGISAGLCGTGLCFLGLQHLDAGVMSFLEKLQAVFVIIFGRIVLGEVLPRRNIPIVVLTLVLACLLLVDNALDLALMNVNILCIVALTIPSGARGG